MTKNQFRIFSGKPLPLGATFKGDSTSFSVFSRHAEKIWLLLFKKSTDGLPFIEIEFDPEMNKTGDIWHMEVFGVNQGDLYNYRVKGPYAPKDGHRFNENKLLVDPYAKALTGDHDWKLDTARGYNWNSPKQDLSFSQLKNDAFIPKCIVIDDYFDWGHIKKPKIPLKDTIIYEAHVKGMTFHSSSNVNNPGTYKGLIEKIPYFKKLGVTAIELLPVHEFDAKENFRKNPINNEQLTNYWGYSTFTFFAPKGLYASNSGKGEQVNEFKEMVKKFHEEGLEIILDVVFNHTGEGNEKGLTLSFRGFDNIIYYMLHDLRFYKNYSGCGNTLNCNHPIVRDFILDCLRYWVTEMHIDGFRFDLASILGRDKDGTVLQNPPLLEKIAEDPILRDTKIIAEAWDAAGLYQVGSFPGGRWAEWNGKYRDTLRAYWKGDYGKIGELATRISGSSDLYQNSGRNPFHSINFITCHDGFTLNDLVSFNQKHNEDNAENNQDGENNNLSYNYGIEGETDDIRILTVRLRMRKNFIASLFLSQGVPMILAGDEFGRTQKGNNNAWCQDNEISWVNWDLLKTENNFFRFVSQMIDFRKRHIAFRRQHFFKGDKGNQGEIPDINWYDFKGYPHKWHYKSKTLAFFLSGCPEDTGFEVEDSNFYIMMNAHHKPITFRLPKEFKNLEWKMAINTAMDAPYDIYETGKAPSLKSAKKIKLEGRSLIVLRSAM